MQRLDRVEGGSPSGQQDAEVAALREQQARTDAALAQLKSRLDALEAAQRSSAQSANPKLDDEVKSLHAALDQYGQRLGAVEQSVAQSQRGGKKSVAARSAPEKSAPRPPAAGVAAQPPPAPAVVIAPPVKGGAQEKEAAPQDKSSVLALAREQEQKGQRAVARDLYEQYAADYPTDPSTAEAHYRLGELAYGEKRYRDAIGEFGKVASEFPRSERAPDALLRTGESMLKLDMKDDAATLLAEIPKRYPGTPAATRAKKQLAELQGSSAQK